MDWGWRAVVKSDTVRRLDARFSHLPCQLVMVRCLEMKTVGRVNWRQAVMDGRGRGKVVMSEKGQMFMDLFIKPSKVQKNVKNQVKKWSSTIDNVQPYVPFFV